MVFFSLSRLAVSRWKNGGGETREICRIARPDNEGEFGWRASLATLMHEGDFSLFPGVDRVMTPVSGEAVDLLGDGWRHRLGGFVPFAFQGEQTVRARPDGAPSLALNIMTDRRDYHADVGVVSRFLPRQEGGDGLVYVLSGEWDCGLRRLCCGDGVWWRTPQAPPALTPRQPGSQLLYAAITPTHPTPDAGYQPLKRPTS
ncbi:MULTISPECIES: HutD/Ves family protein [Dickeya]|uniref:Various environmental stresses. Cold and stress-inducible protein n=1 Tax=Dickeya aquatica TaxID=1401087 RepID=A0A375A7V1_9GAMM|nr:MULTISPECIES: HutD family protein [Dickeya]SLM62188.1 Various environmental stresses. Cold and stress-inducible protein [Dickeya aquatica]